MSNLLSPSSKSDTPRQPILEHIDALRSALFWSAIWIAAGSVAGYFISDRLLDWLARPVTRLGYALYFTKPGEAFAAKCILALAGGFVIAFPAVAWQFWRFFSPALHPGEKKSILPWLFWSTALFAAGIAFALFGALSWTLEFLLSFSSPVLKPMLSVSEYLAFVTTFALSFGVGFNLPVVMAALSGSGVIKPEFFGRYRRHAYVLIFIFGAVLTPPDVASQLMLSLPLVFLYEAGILASHKMMKRSRHPEEQSSPRHPERSEGS